MPVESDWEAAMSADPPQGGEVPFDIVAIVGLGDSTQLVLGYLGPEPVEKPRRIAAVPLKPLLPWPEILRPNPARPDPVGRRFVTEPVDVRRGDLGKEA